MPCPLALRKSNFINILLFTAELQGDGDVHALVFPTYASKSIKYCRESNFPEAVRTGLARQLPES